MRKRLRKKLETMGLVPEVPAHRFDERPPRRSRLVYLYGLTKIKGGEVNVFTARPRRHSGGRFAVSIDWKYVAEVRTADIPPDLFF